MKIGDTIPKFEAATEWLNALEKPPTITLKVSRRSSIFGRRAAAFAK
jgi:hypothetical protein